MIYQKFAGVFSHHFQKIVAVLLVVCLLFSISPLQIVLADSYVDDFSTVPFSGSVTSFSTGTLAEGLTYTCSNCEITDQGGYIQVVSISYPGQASITITARDAGKFLFNSIYLDTVYALELSGNSTPPFSIAIPENTANTFSPTGGGKVVDHVVISNVGPTYEDYNIFIDNVSVFFGPMISSFTRQTPLTTPTNADSLVFRATFSEGVQNVSIDDFEVNGATTATITNVSSISSLVYDITVSGGDLAGYNGVVGIDLSTGQNITSTADGSALMAGEPSTDETYTLDNTGPTVTINQAASQLDPATSGPINFTAVFNESVTDFATGDVTLSGTAGATTATVTGSGTTYNVAVSGMNVDGTVIASIGAGAASDSLGNPSSASTSTDNQVTFDGSPEIDIQRPASTSIADGGTDALGNQSISSSVNLTYTVDNSAGSDTLSVTGVTASGESNVSGFTLGTTMPLSIPAGSTDTFDISFDITYNGAFSFDMAVANNDSTENPYNITVSGTGTGGAPEIDIQRPASTSIADGGTDALGNRTIGTVSLTYTVDNSAGTDQLSITNVTSSNESNVSGFSLDTATPINVAAGSTGTFDISFDVGINGAFSFDMAIANNDSTENPYDITVSGTGTGGAPEIDIQRPASTSIADGGTDVIGANPIGTINLTYTVDNSAGTDQLTISNVTATNLTNASGFSSSISTPINIAAGDTGTFDVSFSTSSIGAFSLDMDVTNTDSDEGNYDITISGTAYIEPEIAVSYNGINISDGDSTPSTADGTDFGQDLINYLPYSPEHTFTITNSGAGTLILTNTPRVDLTGTDFILVTDAPTSIAPGAEATFVVRFAATSVGARNGTIYIDNNDTNENPFNFSITGTGYSGPLMSVQGGSPLQDIENGDTTPDTADNTEFLAAAVSGGTVDHFFTIQNYGDGALSLSGSPIVSIGGTNAADFTVTLQPLSSIGSGANDTFTIRFDPSAAGNRTAIVSIANDDPNNNPYTFTIEGQGDDFSVMAAGNTSPTDGAVLSSAPGSLRVQFSRNALADGSAGAANYTGNYLLVEDGVNNTFDTISCAGGVVSDDTQINIASISYNALSYTATLTVNSGDFVSGGSYRLFVCGTTSVEDTFGNELNGGTVDTLISFVISAAGGGTGTSAVTSLPATGFPMGNITHLPAQPNENQYVSSNLVLEIPVLDISLPIVGVPLVDGTWDVSWLDHAAGYLNGTAYPTWAGNTIITGHVWDALNQPGPFANLKELHYGDLLKITNGTAVYTYEVRDTRLFKATSINAVIRHEELDWVTLVTCEDYQNNNDTYAYRRVVRAVLVKVTPK